MCTHARCCARDYVHQTGWLRFGFHFGRKKKKSINLQQKQHNIVKQKVEYGKD